MRASLAESRVEAAVPSRNSGRPVRRRTSWAMIVSIRACRLAPFFWARSRKPATVEASRRIRKLWAPRALCAVRARGRGKSRGHSSKGCGGSGEPPGDPSARAPRIFRSETEAVGAPGVLCRACQGAGKVQGPFVERLRGIRRAARRSLGKGAQDLPPIERVLHAGGSGQIVLLLASRMIEVAGDGGQCSPSQE